jgi:hypothetical protein
MRNARIVELVFFTQYFGGSPAQLFHKDNHELKTKLAILKVKSERLDSAISNLFDMVEAGDKEAKKRIELRRREKSDTEHELAIIKGSITEDAELPTALDKLDELLFTDKGQDALEQFYPKLEKTLADFNTRKKLLNVLPLIFSKVVFDTTKNTLQPFRKDGTPLPLVDMNTFEEP